jgi:hypothetical protein
MNYKRIIRFSYQRNFLNVVTVRTTIFNIQNLYMMLPRSYDLHALWMYLRKAALFALHNINKIHLYNRCEKCLTARYELSLYIKETKVVFKG